MYKIVKVGAMYHVVDTAGKIQFRSMVRANCKDWLREVAGQDDTQKT